MSLRLKAGLLIAAIVVSVTAVAAVTFAALQYKDAAAVEAQNRRLVIDDVARTVGESQLAKDPLMLLDALRALVARHEVLYARARLGSGWQDVGAHVAPGEARVELVRDSAGSDAVQLGFSLKAEQARLAKRWRSLLQNAARTGLMMTLFGILLALPLSATLTSRIRRIEAALHEIGAGQLAVRLPPLGRDEIGRLAVDVNAMADRLREVEDLKRTFVASVTHELRSPLGVMEGYLEQLLRRPSGLTEQDRKDLQRVQANARRLSHFVTNLLDYAKIERGKLDFAPRSADLTEIVESAVTFFEPKAKEAGIALALELEPGLPAARIDPDLYTHVLTNLISNALKFTRAGGSVRVGLRRAEGQAELSVADTGVGIKPEDVPRLFAPFERVANPLKATGVGLGLAISKQIASLHQGRLGVTSEWGKGSRFTFTIPLSAS